jgi:hypothetical protein
MLHFCLKHALALSFILCLAALSGCSVLIRPALVPNRHVERWDVIDPNDYDIRVTETEDGSKTYHWNRSVTVDDQMQPIPYWDRKNYLNPAVVRGQLNGTTYVVIFDTGNNLGVLIEDIQINRHDLGVFFFNSENKNASDGLAIAASLTVGPLTFENYPCSFLKYRAEHRLLGILPIHRFQWVIMPLQVISSFRYVEYNQLSKELTISLEDPFVPQDASEWLQYPFEIDKNRILITTFIEDIQAVLFLDTGASGELELSQTLVEQLYEKRPDLRTARKKNVSVYTPYADGVIKGKRFTAKNLRFAESCLTDVELIYKTAYSRKTHFPYDDTNGTIGLGLFGQTAMVLDFETNRMWVKKAEGSPFEQRQSDEE